MIETIEVEARKEDYLDQINDFVAILSSPYVEMTCSKKAKMFISIISSILSEMEYANLSREDKIFVVSKYLDILCENSNVKCNTTGLLKTQDNENCVPEELYRISHSNTTQICIDGSSHEYPCGRIIKYNREFSLLVEIASSSMLSIEFFLGDSYRFIEIRK
ncbi:MAG: hypothetical protein ACRCX2_17560 [Paraclostridium sp.]